LTTLKTIIPVRLGRLSISPQVVGLLKRSGTQAVITWGGQRTPGAHWLRMDMTEPGIVAAQHLLEQGRRSIGVIVPRDPTLDYFSGPRLEGARTAAARFARREKLAKADAPRVVRIDLDYSEEAAADLAARLPQLGLDAIFAYNDEYAMLIAASLHDAGVRIPADVALVGADDLMLCRLLRPRLTSVRTEMPGGPYLAELIDRLVNADDGEPQTFDMGTAQIVVRESC
jgi:DNA-binding LacI/PurR family transcriptional regulator